MQTGQGQEQGEHPRRRLWWSSIPATREARALDRWGKRGRGRGELGDVLTLEGRRRQGGRWRCAAAAGGGLPRRRRSGVLPAVGRVEDAQLDGLYLLVVLARLEGQR
jgi:hypothetical protein